MECLRKIRRVWVSFGRNCIIRDMVPKECECRLPVFDRLGQRHVVLPAVPGPGRQVFYLQVAGWALGWRYGVSRRAMMRQATTGYTKARRLRLGLTATRSTFSSQWAGNESRIRKPVHRLPIEPDAFT